MALRCLALGDIALEIDASIPDSFTDINAHRLYQLPVDVRIGGTAAHFASHAQSLLGPSTIVGTVGNDIAGKFLIQQLQESKLELFVSIEDESETSKIIMVYDACSPINHRILIVNNPNANDKFSKRHLDLCTNQLFNTDILFVSGHNARSEPRWSTSLMAMEIVSQKGGVVVFDLVPHDLYETITFDTLKTWTKHVSVLVAEVATLRRFLHFGHPAELIDRELVERTLKDVIDIFPVLILGYGPNNYEYQCIATRDKVSFYETGFPSLPVKTGIGEWLVVNALDKLFSYSNSNSKI